MNLKKNNYVEKEKKHSQEELSTSKKLSLQDQLEVFAKIIVDIYFENLLKQSNEKK